jgi:predicted GTPase
VVNKWDLAVEAAQKAADASGRTTGGKAKIAAEGGVHRREIDKGKLLLEYENMVKEQFKFLSYAPIVFLSAKTGERAQKLYSLIDEVALARNRKIPTPELNNWLKEDVDLQRASNPKARPIRIYYITQAKVAPPVFLLFTNQKKPLHFNFERFLENQLRAKWDFMGTPVRFIQRLKKRGDRERATSTEE